jgi:hypothetical protein
MTSMQYSLGVRSAHDVDSLLEQATTEILPQLALPLSHRRRTLVMAAENDGGADGDASHLPYVCRSDRSSSMLTSHACVLYKVVKD